MNDNEKRLLYKHLELLVSSEPTLEARIRWPIDQEHLTLDEMGVPHYLLHSSWLSFSLDDTVDLADIEPFKDQILLFGVGFGEIIEQALAQFPNSRVLAWERDPALLRFLMMQRDFTHHLESGRLTFLLGVDLLKYLNQLPDSAVVFHPLFSQIYSLEKNVLAHGAASLFALALGELFVDDLALTLGSQGFTPWPVDLQRWSVEELRYSILQLQPLFLASINYINGTAEFCEQNQLPYLCWEIDPDMNRELVVTSSTSQSYIFSYRRKNMTRFRKGGFQHVFHLPLASNTAKRQPADPHHIEDKYKVPLAFVGRSMVAEATAYRKAFVELYAQMKNQASGAEDQCEQVLQEILDQQLLDCSNYLIPGLFQDKFSDLEQFCITNNVLFDPLKIISQIAAAERRLLYIASLGKYGMHVWGDEGWLPVEQYGSNHMGAAGHHHEVTKIYNGAAINVDIGRLYQLDIVTMRVFDVLACGGFLIAEYSDELADLFELGHDLESYKTIEELENKVRYYLDEPEKRLDIARNGLAKVRACHTFDHRVRQIIETMGM